MSRHYKIIYDKLLKHFGSQSWWPADSRFEVIVGAILTQNTAWTNVEKAIKNLKEAKILDPHQLHNFSNQELARYLKPAGFFNIKAKRLKNFLDFFMNEFDGNIEKMRKEDPDVLRKKLLSVNGIGPETADSILLYALDRPIFVVDAYTKRIFYRHNLVEKDDDYSQIQQKFSKYLKRDRKLFSEYHALIVRLGKDYCRPSPKCTECPLNNTLYSLESRCQKCFRAITFDKKTNICQQCLQ